MAGKTLVALDGSRTSESILPYVDELLRNEDADVTFAMAVRTDSLKARQAARAYLREVARRTAEKGAFADYRILIGEAGPALVAFAEAEGYDRVALCSHGRSGVRRLLLGSVAEQILRSSRTPVLVVHPRKPGSPAPRLKKIVAAVDGSHRSLAVEKPVADLARAQGAAVCFVNVVLPSGREELPVEVVAENVFQANRRVKALGVKSDVTVLYGDPAQETLMYAEKVNADLIAVATHGRRGAARILQGSVTEQLLRKGDLPLLVVHADAVLTKKTLGPAARRARRRSLDVLSRRGVHTTSPYHT